jgi:drug/metabolite transporter (DMT)-like permease
MNWFVLALISSIALSLRESVVKKQGASVSPVFMSWGLNFFSFLIILTINIIRLNWHPVTAGFLVILFCAAILDSLATVLYFWAIKSGNLSKTIPMLCFIPVVQLFVTPVLIHENLSASGVAGVLVVVFGSYLLNLEKWQHMASPFKVLFTEKSTLMMLCVAILWGVSTSFHKMGVRQTDALFWGVAEIGLISLFLLPAAFLFGKNEFGFANLKVTFLPAVFSVFTVLSYYSAINLGPVAYVSSVRRLGVLFSMVAGMLFFKEQLKPIGFAGGLIMIAGAAVITLFG